MLNRNETTMWKTAEAVILNKLTQLGYTVLSDEITQDCIIYNCLEDDQQHDIFAFINPSFDNLSLSNLNSRIMERTKGTSALVTFFYAESIEDEWTVSYFEKERKTRLWQLLSLGGKTVLAWYPGLKEIRAIDKLMYAYNHANDDILHEIVVPSSFFSDYSVNGTALHGGFFTYFERIQEECGLMKKGYLSVDNVIYFPAPYIENYGILSIIVNEDGKIDGVYGESFDYDKISDYICTQEREPSDLFDYVPELKSVLPLPPKEHERFSLKLLFSNGEQRKYVLPITDEQAADEVISFRGHVFTDKIWASAAIKQNPEPRRGPAVTFRNELYIPAFHCYENSFSYCGMDE